MTNFFQQVTGVAMSVANSFMSMSEKVLKARQDKLRCYKRYINDIFIIWEGKDSLKKK